MNRLKQELKNIGTGIAFIFAAASIAASIFGVLFGIVYLVSLVTEPKYFLCAILFLLVARFIGRDVELEVVRAKHDE